MYYILYLRISQLGLHQWFLANFDIIIYHHIFQHL